MLVLAGFLQVVGPETFRGIDNLTAGQLADFSSIAVTNVGHIIGVVLRDLVSGVLGISVDGDILEHVDSTNLRETCLHNVAQMRISAQSKLLSCVHGFEFRHKRA